jgi:hypothetical protein
MGNNTSTKVRDSIDDLYYEAEALDGWRQKIELDKWKQRGRDMGKSITGTLEVVGVKIPLVNSPQILLKKLQRPVGTNTEKNVRRKPMEKMKLSQAYIIGETIVWSLFIIVMALTGFAMMHVIKLSDGASMWLGRVALSFSLLAFFYIAYLGIKQRTK